METTAKWLRNPNLMSQNHPAFARECPRRFAWTASEFRGLLARSDVLP